MQFFRLLHRRTKSENDVSTLLFSQGSGGVTAPVFVPLHASLPSFDPTRDLYGSPTDLVQRQMDRTHELDSRIIGLEAQLAYLQNERSNLEQDLADYRADLLHARTELYSEMLGAARHQQQAMDYFRTIQKLEARHQRFCNMLVDIGIPRSTVDGICEVIQSGNGSPEDILVDAIKHAANDDSTLLTRLKPIVTEERTPEHYQSALNLTLSIRKELKSQKKRSKFWKKLAQEDGRRGNIITPSPSDISSIRSDLSPARRSALDALIARRLATKYPDSIEGDVFGGQRNESALDTLASSLASRPRHSIPDDLGYTSSFSSSSASSASTTYLSYLSSRSRVHREVTTETPTIPSRLPSTLSTSLRRSSRGSSQSIVLGNISLNVSRSSAIDPALREETEQQTNPDTGPASTVTRSQDLLQNDRRASQGHGHRRMPSMTSRRPGHRHSTHSSFRLSALSPIRAPRPTGPPTGPNSDISGNTAVETAPFHTPHITMRLSDLATSSNSDTDTPATSDVTRSEDTPFNDTHALPKYCADTPLSPTDLEPRLASTPLDGSIACEPLGMDTCLHDTQFLEHLDSSMSMTMSVSTSVSASESSAHAQDGQEREDNHARTDANTNIIPLGESNDSLFTSSASSSVTASETPAPTTPPTPSSSPIPSPSIGSTPPTGKASIGRSMLPVLAKHLRRLSLSGTSPDRELLVGKFRGLCSLSRSRSGSGSGSGSPLRARSVWRGSPSRSESSNGDHLTPSPSPVKGSGIPVLQRRMTIRARRTSVRKV